MDALINGLPRNSTNDAHRFYVIYDPTSDRNVCTTTQVAAAKAKGWTTFYHDSVWKEYAGSDPANISGLTMDEDKNSPIYSITGQKLSKPRKGINIIGGKKVIVK